MNAIVDEFNNTIKRLVMLIYDIGKNSELSDITTNRNRIFSVLNYTPLTAMETVGPCLFDNKDIIYHEDLYTILQTKSKFREDMGSENYDTLVQYINTIYALLSDNDKHDIEDGLRTMLDTYIQYLIYIKKKSLGEL